MIYTFIFFASLVLTIILTPFLISYLKKSQVVDTPGARRINKNIVPRMGGIVIFSVVMLLIFSFYPNLNSIRYMIVGALIISVCGTLDDIIGITWNIKFLFEFLSTALLIAFLDPLLTDIRFFGIVLPSPLDYLFLAFFIVGVINSINLLDGLDGLASGYSLLVSLLFFFFAIQLNNVLLIILTTSLAGSLLGFLKYNAYPAKIFLGDTGSLVLGFFLLTITMLTSLGVYNSHLDLTFPIIVFGVPIIDTIKVMLIRLLNKKNPFHPDKTHIHHVIFDNKIHHKFTVFIIQISTILYLALALLYYQGFQELAVVFFFVLGVLMVFADFIFAKVQFISRSFQKLYNKNLRRLPENISNAYKNVLIPLTLFVAMLLLILLLPVRTSLNKDEILFLLVVGSFVIMLAYVHYKRTKELAAIYVLLNIIVYLIFSSLSESFYAKIQFHTDFNLDIIGYTFTFIFFVVVVYIALKERFFKNTEAFFSGIDLIVILLVCFLFIINNIVSFERLEFLNMSLFHAFILYLLFKIIEQINLTFAKIIFSVSFVLPAFSLLYMLII